MSIFDEDQASFLAKTLAVGCVRNTYLENIHAGDVPLDDENMKPDIKTKRSRLAEDIRRMQEIEGNPFTIEDEAMFAMFERKGWSAEKRADYIRSQFVDDGAHVAAE